MNKWFKIILIFAALGIVAALVVFKFYINKAHPDYENLPPDFQLTTEALYNEYIKDKASAELKYNGKLIELNGKITNTEQVDTLIVVTFVFKQGDFGDEGIRCTLLPKYNENVKTFSTGSDIRIKGYCTGYNDTDVILEKSSIVN